VNPIIQSILVAALGGGLVGLLMFRSNRKKAEAEARASNAAAAQTEDDTARKRFEDIEGLRNRIIAAEDHARACDDENRLLRTRIERLEAATAMVVVASRIDDYASLADLWDLMPAALVFSAPSNDGTFLWVNTAFCALLGYSRDEVLARGWRQLVHPDDRGKTSVAEATAWTDRVWGFINRYVCKDGSVVLLKWHCPAYKQGVTVSFVSVVEGRRKGDPS